jgi:serine/threonine protein kinase
MDAEEEHADPPVPESAIEELLGDMYDFLVSSNDFEVRKRIGKGAFGEVFYGIHRLTGRKAAVKRFLFEEFTSTTLRYFCREVKILASVTNFFLLPFFGFSVTFPYIIVTEFIPRGSLFEALRHARGSPLLTPDHRLLIALGMARGMMSLHRQKIVHRDLKSMNVLLDEDLLPRICDFGIARFLNSQTEQATQRVGTPYWMAPEIFEGENYSHKVDVYAFGVLLWELLTEQIPFNGRSAMQVITAVTQRPQRPIIPENCPVGLRQLIECAWDHNPYCRPSFAQIARKLVQGQIHFPNGNASAINGFLKRFPLSQEELAQLTTPDEESSADFENGYTPMEHFDVSKYAVRPGERSPVEVKQTPLCPGAAQRKIPRMERDSVDSASGLEIQHSSSGSTPMTPPTPMPAIPVESAVQAGPVMPRSENVFLKEFGGRCGARAALPVNAPPPVPESKNIFLWESAAEAAPAKPSPFGQIFADRLAVLEKESAADFFAGVAGQLRRNISDGMRNEIQGQLSIFLMRRPQFAALLLSTPFFSLVDFGNVARFDINLRLVVACLVAEGGHVALPTVRPLILMANAPDRARRLLKFLQLFLKYGLQTPEAVSILSLFIENRRFFITDHHFIRLLYLASHCPQFASLIPSISAVFRDGLLAQSPEVVHAAALVLCRVPCSASQLPITEIVQAIAENRCTGDYLLVLAHLPSFPVSARFVQAILVAATSPLSIVVLCRVAAVPEGTTALLQAPQWTQPGMLAPTDAVTLLLTIGQHPEARARLADVAGIAPFLAWVASEAPELESLAPLLRRIRITPEFFAAIEAAGFFTVYFTRVLSSTDPQVRDAAVLLVDKYGRFAWAEGFSAFIEHLPVFFLSDSKWAAKALVAAIVLAGHTQAKPIFAKAGITAVIRQAAIGEKFEAYRMQLLQMIERAV